MKSETWFMLSYGSYGAAGSWLFFEWKKSVLLFIFGFIFTAIGLYCKFKEGE